METEGTIGLRIGFTDAFRDLPQLQLHLGDAGPARRPGKDREKW
jgi:hypothetical protein